MKSLKTILLLLTCSLVFGSVAAADKKVHVVCTLPTLKALTAEVGGDRVDVIALARGDQDPHFVTPTPVLMKKTREADLFIENGFSLELWANEVVNGSGNPKIFGGTRGRIIASYGISPLEVPSVISRELGDIHPQGNPHVWLDPLEAKIQAGNICEALKAEDPAGASYYESRKGDFFRRVDNALFGPELLKLVGIQKLTRLAWSGQLQNFLETQKIGGQPLSEKTGGWLKAAESLRGKKAYEFHKVWVYFARVFGLQLVGTIEERPGIPPGPQHLRQVTEKMKADKIPLILVDNFYDPSSPNNIARETGAKVVLLPNQVEGEPGIRTYFDLINHIIRKITEALK
ncbi:MAG TPA: metal ABC transporter substrate-binding protein [Acidobacteriota bacterium]|jgi:ABC-type Zn uptake system ZnuABC Zn-binding protein ZnuA|nr:metal ABC transporter substrate-binding protein [Acidobacteriota bacterium]